MPKRVSHQTFQIQKKRYYRKHRYGVPHRWTDIEDILVLGHSISDVKLAQDLKRSVEAIWIRRMRLKNGEIKTPTNRQAYTGSQTHDYK
jgi:hypothetical protein